MSSRGKIDNSLKRGLVWSVHFENVIIIIIFLCNLLIGCNLDVNVFPHAMLFFCFVFFFCNFFIPCHYSKTIQQYKEEKKNITYNLHITCSPDGTYTTTIKINTNKPNITYYKHVHVTVITNTSILC